MATKTQTDEEYIDWDALLGEECLCLPLLQPPDISPDSVKNATSEDLSALFPDLMCAPMIEDVDSMVQPREDATAAVFQPVVVTAKPQPALPNVMASQLLTPPLSERAFSPPTSVKNEPFSVASYLPTPGTPSMGVANWATASAQEMLAMAMFPPIAPTISVVEDLPRAETAFPIPVAPEATPILNSLGASPILNSLDSAQMQMQKKRRRAKDDEEEVSDEVKLKRMKNTEAARRSRQRKAERLDHLEVRAAELEAANAELRAQYELFEEERRRWEEEEGKYAERIAWLQARLTEAREAIRAHGGAVAGPISPPELSSL
ncbi:hypothetical protein M427DRAFT_63045 [Gonapodya prolifera JEL478]|uniref:BZIP domain-containing protein n=1 Tax=Gonapodya prolifera (strain JEL478) TaxID=1344416 RepID=A0A139A0F9_GONPJ|nr:hypothetical protein M427DRAFT_63045 [Gonapodya prolifera JEL478]|eukprot:KXS10118.1 hypothetical protein M427DRAFT_63045 [Gonapodya prolifera JEL478]